MSDAPSEGSTFKDLESDICDVLRAAELACQLAFDEGDKIDELLFFSMRQCQTTCRGVEGKILQLVARTLT